MNQHTHSATGRLVENTNGLMLALLSSVLLFLLVRLTFRQSIYALPLLALATLPFALTATNPGWRAAFAAGLSIPFFFLDLILDVDQSLSPAFDLFAAILLIVAAMAVGGSYDRIRRERDVSREQSDRDRAISQLSDSLLTASTVDNLFQLSLQSLQGITERSCVLFALGERGELRCVNSCPEGLLLYPAEDVVRACFQQGIPTGRNTELLSSSPLTCFPLRSESRVQAVMGFLVGDIPLSSAQLQTVNALLLRINVAMERLILAQREQIILMEKELEHMRSDFLRSISHDFRSPLTAIMGACSALNQTDVALSDNMRSDLIQSISEEASWLLRMVENLLSVTRAGSGAPMLQRSDELVEELVAEVLKQAGNRFPRLSLQVKQPDEPVLIPVDPTLIVQVLMNLIDNAVKYAGTNFPVELTVVELSDCVSFSVRDHGPGFAPGTLATLFQPVAHKSGDFHRGMGLGLSICKSIVSAHGGNITGENDPGGGAKFTVILPKEVLA